MSLDEVHSRRKKEVQRVCTCLTHMREREMGKTLKTFSLLKVRNANYRLRMSIQWLSISSCGEEVLINVLSSWKSWEAQMTPNFWLRTHWGNIFSRLLRLAERWKSWGQLEDCGKEREEVELNREKIRGLETAVRVREWGWYFCCVPETEGLDKCSC